MAMSWCGAVFLWSLVAMALVLTGAEKPVIYIFGDSTVDVGTNDFIAESTARADFFFNGIDFPYSIPTGRFSNGFNTADQIVRLLGYKRSPPPYLYLINNPSTFKQNILQGANFASGGSGILNQTGQKQYNRVISVQEQIQQFSYVREVITNMTGSQDATNNFLSKAFFLISVGSNDIFEYLLNPNKTQTSVDFIDNLQYEFIGYLTDLYLLGARKFGILAVPLIGCCPFARAFTGDGTCDDDANELARLFNAAVDGNLPKLSYLDQGMDYSFGNTYEMTQYIIDDPLAFGFTNVASPCCGNGTYPCNQTATICDDHREFLFWDQFHPTEHASELAAQALFGGSTNLVHPKNFSSLLQIYAP